ncbi:MAG: hypothetical protein EP317_03945 [Bacillota bacterium]|nr:MAG: hypothetical protein EP317_03945 [Bacillota bacterium]
MKHYSHVIIVLQRGFIMRKSIILFIILLTSLYVTSMITSLANQIELDVVDSYIPTFSHESGFYDEDFYLILTPKPNTTIYYTLDGSDPTLSSTIYTEPLLIEEQYIEATGEEILIQNRIEGYLTDPIPTYPISFIRTGTDKWKSPQEDVFKATILKVKAVHTSGNESPILTNTYFVDTNMYEKYTFPIISITTDINNLYNYRTGINVPGIHYDPTIEEINNQNRTGNYYQSGPEWEKPVYIEYFETDGTRVLAQEAGIRVHGGLSRKYPIKSYRLYARSEYDETTYFNYSFFEDQDIDRFKRIVLRGGGQTYEYSFIGEATAQGLLKTMDLEMQYSSPVILFMNGEYFGIRNIRDRFDDWYLEIKYDVPRENVTILTGHGSVADGNPSGQAHYLDMYRYILRNSMATKRHYDYINTQMDIDNFIDYYAAELYFANVDWPQNNIQYWRYNTPYSSVKEKGQDGRWRWMVYDVDAGFGASWGGYYPEYNSFERITGDSWKTGQMFTKLLNNEGFKLQFINRMMDLLNSNFSSSYASSYAQSMIDLYAPEMQEHIDYYGYPSTYNSWISYTNRMKTFALNRPTYLREHMQEYFNLEGMYELSLKSNIDQGTIKVNTINVAQAETDNPWVGTYFDGLSLNLQAQPKKGFKIVGWYDAFDNLLSDKLTYSISPTEDTFIKVVYEVGTQIYPSEGVDSETILFISVSSSLVVIFSLAIVIDIYRKKKKII